MRFKYTTKEGIFETNDWREIPLEKLHSLNDEPCLNCRLGYKEWRNNGKLHREIGPAVIWANGNYSFWINNRVYENVNDWLEDNPNKDITFQTQMRLKYT